MHRNIKDSVDNTHKLGLTEKEKKKLQSLLSVSLGQSSRNISRTNKAVIHSLEKYTTCNSCLMP